jgi:glutaredoxin-related protein
MQQRSAQKQQKLPRGFYAYLLQSCPWSQKVSRMLSSKEEKQWVRRGSQAFDALREEYDWPTFPIVFFHDKKIGGYDELMQFLKTSASI